MTVEQEKIEKMFSDMYDKTQQVKVSKEDLVVDTVIVLAEVYKLCKSYEARIQELEQRTKGLPGKEELNWTP